jgi:cytochrome P450
VTLRNTTIPAGGIVMLINGSATRDERACADPDRFDIDRKPSGHNLNFGERGRRVERADPGDSLNRAR